MIGINLYNCHYLDIRIPHRAQGTEHEGGHHAAPASGSLWSTGGGRCKDNDDAYKDISYKQLLKMQ